MVRFTIYIAITLVAGILFTFIPAFNWNAHQEISVYEQFIVTGQIWEFIKYVGGVSLIVFFSLWTMYGSGNPKPDIKEGEETKEA